MHAETFLKEFATLASGPGGVQKLRALVLSLAISGRLSTRYQSDGDAGTLVEAAVKAIKSAISDRTIRKPRYFEKPAIADQELDLPPNWISTTLGNLGLISPRNEALDNAISGFVPMAAIEAKYGLGHSSEQRQWSEIKSGYTHIADGDVVLAKITPCFENGKSTTIANLLGGIGAGTTELHVFRQLVPVVESGYLLAFLKSGSFIETGIPKMTGTAGQKRVPADYFALTPFPLPPLAEQKRIVAKVDELMVLCDALEAQQAEETGLKRAAAASALHHLTEAKTSGEVADRWSVFAPRFGEMFDDLETIAQLKEVLLELSIAGQFDRLSGVEESDAEVTEIGEVASVVGGSTPTKQKSEFWNGDIPWISPKDMKVAEIEDAIDHVTDKAVSETNIKMVSPGSVLTVVRGMILAKTLPVAILRSAATINQDMKALIPKDGFLSEYLALTLNGSKRTVLSVVERSSHGTCRLDTNKLLSVPIRRLSEDNQRRIVAKVDELMAYWGRLEEQVREGERLNAELMASLVHALTETDPDGGGAEPLGSIEDAPEISMPEQANRDAPKTAETQRILPSRNAKTKAHAAQDRAPNVDTKFQEAVLVAAIVDIFFQAGGEPIGNFRLQKAVYFARRKMGEQVGEMAYLKKAAGPYNPSMKYSGGIAIAKQKNWLREARGRFGFGHVPGQDAGDAAEWIKNYGYGEPARWVAEHFRYKKNEEWETLATVDYAIEHLQTLGIDPDAAQILQYIQADDEWRPKIEKLRLTEMLVGTAMLEVQALFSPQGVGDVA